MPEWVNNIIPVISALLGTALGAWATYLATAKLETQKLRQQKRDAYALDRREALKEIMNWLDPIDRAISVVSMQAAPFRTIDLTKDVDNPKSKWPDLLHELADMDLPAQSRFLLPPGIYESPRTIIELINEIDSMNLELIHRQKFFSMKKHPSIDNLDAEGRLAVYKMNEDDIADLRSKLFEKITILQELSIEYQQRLMKEYRDTYQ